MNRWHFTGDVNWIDYGGKWIRLSHDREFQVIEFVNMHEAVGEKGCKSSGQDKYVVEFSTVDLDSLGPQKILEAQRSCGIGPKDETDDMWDAEMCHSYGHKCMVEAWSGTNANKLLAVARRAAKSAR